MTKYKPDTQASALSPVVHLLALRGAFACLLLFVRVCLAEDVAGLAFFEQRVRPVFVQHCYGCHSDRAEHLKGGLLLDSQAGWQTGGDSGKSPIVGGDPDASMLIQYVRHADGLKMPPESKLPDAVIADLVTWVKMGAPDSRTTSIVEVKRADKAWWSLQPITTIEPPTVDLRRLEPLVVKEHPVEHAVDLQRRWQHPIDRFILEKLVQSRLLPNPPANARDLIRRMSYDVIGLPPTANEADAFTKDYAVNRSAAVEMLVDRLLASDHYGEHWGRHWLDVVRFGESNGFERNSIIDELWPFRDFVIRSFNTDKPFQRFIIEHLAGDIVGKDQPEVEVGCAFLVAGPYDDVGNQDLVAKANIRAATLDEIITATGSAFLGLTINCARCHHHKFDPIPTEDYYRMRAAFEGVVHGRRVIASPSDRERFTTASQPLNEAKAALTMEKAVLETAIETLAREEFSRRTFARPTVDPQFTDESFPPVEAKFIRFVMTAHTGNPKGAVGSRMNEFQVWSSESTSRNVALAANGTTAEGAQATRADDFPEAYGAPLVIDGIFAEQWFIGNPAELYIRLSRPETIQRIAFSNSRGIDTQRKGVQGESPCEYEVQISMDESTWITVANSRDRQPWSEAHGLERIRREVISSPAKVTDTWQTNMRVDLRRLAEIQREVARLQRDLDQVPPLPQVWAGNPSQPTEDTRVHLGGDPMRLGEPVVPSSLSVLDQVTMSYELAVDAPEGERRLALAKWITSDENPITARVLANRIWHYHFGTGIVDTPSDFGFLGSQPTHPELLDWLAQRLQQHGWRLKPLHREILLSQTYQQSADYRSAAAAIDKDSRQLWRFPPRRLSAEELRDTLLFVSGKLAGMTRGQGSDPTQPAAENGGPGFRLYKVSQNNVSTYFPLDEHGPDTYRRGVYHQGARASVVDILSEFDLPDTAFAAPKRAHTITPMQALTMLNHRFVLDMAAGLSERATAMNTTEPEVLVDSIYALTLQRKPSLGESKAAMKLLETHGSVALCRAMLNLNELLFLE